MGEQFEAAWPELLGAIAGRLNPLHDEIFKAAPMAHFWTGHQVEWATEVLFELPDARETANSPALVQHALHSFMSPGLRRSLERGRLR